MTNNDSYTLKLLRLPLGILVFSVLFGCGSYENASKDGIYSPSNENTSEVENTENIEATPNTEGNYYQNYFRDQGQQISEAKEYNDQNAVFTDIDSYSSNQNYEEGQVYTDSQNYQTDDYNSYGSWGSNATTVNVNYYNNNPYMWGGWYDPWMYSAWGGWGYYGPYYGPGWRVGYAWGWPGYYGYGGWGYYGWNNWGYYNPYHYHANYGVAYQSYGRNYRSSSYASRTYNGRRDANNISRRDSRITDSPRYSPRTQNTSRVRNSNGIDARKNSTTTRTTRNSTYRNSDRSSRNTYYNSSTRTNSNNSSVRSRSSSSPTRTVSPSRSSSTRSSGSVRTGGSSSTRSSGGGTRSGGRR